VKAALAQREAEQTYGVPEQELTDVPWSLYSLRREWNQAKGDVAPWWAECSKEAFSAGLGALARGLKNWNDSRRGKRKGRRGYRAPRRATCTRPTDRTTRNIEISRTSGI
jgi:putative transposase